MSKAPGEVRISQCRSIEALQKGLDQTYRRLVETAKADWQLLFAGPDPDDACVRVRISNQAMAEELAGMPCVDLAPNQIKATQAKVQPR